MQYRFFNGERDELRRRIVEAEQEHYKISLDRKVCENLKRDDLILAADDKLAEIEQTLKVLYAQIHE